MDQEFWFLMSTFLMSENESWEVDVGVFRCLNPFGGCQIVGKDPMREVIAEEGQHGDGVNAHQEEVSGAPGVHDPTVEQVRRDAAVINHFRINPFRINPFRFGSLEV